MKLNTFGWKRCIYRVFMGTFLFDKIIFGPVKSRRLGVSLGINLLPPGCKRCNFNCIYCECGWTPKPGDKPVHFLPERKKIAELLEAKMLEMNVSGQGLDAITFAGNGEPTLHPDFASIIDDTIVLRNKYFRDASIAVLSNGTKIHDNKVFNALLRVDQNILKLDSAFEGTIRLHNNPGKSFGLNETVKKMKKFRGNLIIQTMFIQGTYKKQVIDNTTDQEVEAWLKMIRQIKPKEVMVYTFKRDPASPGLVRVPRKKLLEIGKRVEKLGIKVQVSP